MHYVIWGLKHLLAETDYYRDFLVWDDQHRSWRLPSFSAALGVSLSKDGKRAQPRLILI